MVIGVMKYTTFAEAVCSGRKQSNRFAVLFNIWLIVGLAAMLNNPLDMRL
jgi:hypothetical protein